MSPPAWPTPRSPPRGAPPPGAWLGRGGARRAGRPTSSASSPPRGPPTTPVAPRIGPGASAPPVRPPSRPVSSHRPLAVVARQRVPLLPDSRCGVRPLTYLTDALERPGGQEGGERPDPPGGKSNPVYVEGPRGPPPVRRVKGPTTAAEAPNPTDVTVIGTDQVRDRPLENDRLGARPRPPHPVLDSTENTVSYTAQGRGLTNHPETDRKAGPMLAPGTNAAPAGRRPARGLQVPPRTEDRTSTRPDHP